MALREKKRKFSPRPLEVKCPFCYFLLIRAMRKEGTVLRAGML